jgi:arylsulfatase
MISRRNFLYSTAAGAAVVGLGVHSLAEASSKAIGKRPNIVILFSDELHYNELSCYGGKIPTPNLDLLAPGLSAVTARPRPARRVATHC